MEVPKEIDKILGYLRKGALTTTREFSPHLIFFSLVYFKSKQMYKDLKTISKICLRKVSHMKL